MRNVGTFFRAFVCILFVVGPVAAQVTIDNGVPVGTAGRIETTILGGGETQSYVITAGRLDGSVTTQDVMFDYAGYIDSGGRRGPSRIIDTTSTPPNLETDGTVTSSGSFLGQAGNTISWTAVTELANGSDTLLTTLTFTAQTGTLGLLRYTQYMDEDIEDETDDLIVPSGAASSGDLEVLTLDGPQVYGVGQGGATIATQGLVNASFVGWAAGVYDQTRLFIQAGLLTVSPAGVIDLPPTTHPVIGAAFGPEDVASAFVWLADPSATTATIVTTVGGSPASGGGPNTPPTLECPVAQSFECSGPPAQADITLVASVADTDGDTLTVQWTLDGDVVQTDTVSASATPTPVTFAATLVGLGERVVGLVVTDAESSASCSTTIAVVDTSPPLVYCSTPIVVGNDLGQCSASGVTLSPPQATDNCEIVSIVNDAPASFPIGTTNVTWTVTDIGGLSSTCTTTVTVVDAEPPTVTCELVEVEDDLYVVVINATDNCGDVEPVGHVGCGDSTVIVVDGDEVEIGVKPGSCKLKIGKGAPRVRGPAPYLVVSAVDSSGNGTTCTFEVPGWIKNKFQDDEEVGE